MVYPILVAVIFVIDFDARRSKLSNFNKFQLVLSCLYVAAMLGLLILFKKVKAFYRILWYLLNVKHKLNDSGHNFFCFRRVWKDGKEVLGCEPDQIAPVSRGIRALCLHTDVIYTNICDARLKMHVIGQFFGPFAEIMMLLLGLDKCWDLETGEFKGRHILLSSDDSVMFTPLWCSENNQYQKVGVTAQTVHNAQKLDNGAFQLTQNIFDFDTSSVHV